MQNTTYPHLTQQEGIWRIVQLDAWDPSANCIPLKYHKLSELDVKIFAYIRDVYHVFRQDPGNCLSTPKPNFGIRSPYANISDQTVPYTRALLCMWWDFSYHNWIDHPHHIYLGRMCTTKSCRNPNHQTFGRRKAKAKNIFEIQSIPDSAPPDRDTEDWIDYITGATAEIREGLEAEVDPESLTKEMLARAQLSWGTDRKLPSYALVNYQTVEDFIRDTIRTILRPPTTIPKQDSAQIAESVSAMEDFMKSIERKEGK